MTIKLKTWRSSSEIVADKIPIVEGTNYTRSGTGPKQWSDVAPVTITVRTYDPQVKCEGCGWTGRRSQCAEEELSEGVVDLCPACGSDCF